MNVLTQSLGKVRILHPYGNLTSMNAIRKDFLPSLSLPYEHAEAFRERERSARELLVSLLEFILQIKDHFKLKLRTLRTQTNRYIHGPDYTNLACYNNILNLWNRDRGYTGI